MEANYGTFLLELLNTGTLKYCPAQRNSIHHMLLISRGVLRPIWVEELWWFSAKSIGLVRGVAVASNSINQSRAVSNSMLVQ